MHTFFYVSLPNLESVDPLLKEGNSTMRKYTLCKCAQKIFLEHSNYIEYPFYDFQTPCLYMKLNKAYYNLIEYYHIECIHDYYRSDTYCEHNCHH